MGKHQDAAGISPGTFWEGLGKALQLVWPPLDPVKRPGSWAEARVPSSALFWGRSLPGTHL